ncbi:MAG TPA: hypothetical protein VM532_16020, partial [Burkholderiales bacterium]|nr:hypothetical protein [Burkholderiales bacterium]
QYTVSTARRAKQGFRAACCEPAQRLSDAADSAPCKGNAAGRLLHKYLALGAVRFWLVRFTFIVTLLLIALSGKRPPNYADQ